MPLAKSNQKLNHKWQFNAIGTSWSIETTTELSDGCRSIVEETVESFDRTYSRFRDDSLVSAIEGAAGTYEFPKTAGPLFAFYRRLYDTTHGAVTPLVGGVLAAAGYDKTYSLQPGHVTPAREWDDVMKWDGMTLTTTQRVMLDFGAAGKGYLVDMIAEIFKAHGVDRYVIDASGDIRVHGDEQVIGLENPFDTSCAIGAAYIHEGSLCASAINRRAWGQWHHIVDPYQARPVTEVVATWVCSQSTMHADGIATALFFVDPHELQRLEPFEYVRLRADGKVERSSDFVGELYI